MRQAADFLIVDGVRLECRWIGAAVPDRPTLVFLHEGLGSVAQWRDFPDRVAGRLGLSALVYSRAGYGHSDPVALPRPLDYLEREGLIHLPALLDAAGLEQVVLIGHSDGATIALIQAGRDPRRRVLGVVAMAPHSFVEDLCLDSIARAAQAYRDGELRRRLARYHGDNVDGAFWGWNATWLAPDFRRWHIRDFLATIAAPVLVIQGEDDEYASDAQVRIIQDLVPAGAQALMPAACRHSPHHDQPQLVLEAIAAFITPLAVPAE